MLERKTKKKLEREIEYTCIKSFERVRESERETEKQRNRETEKQRIKIPS